jgi:hypothetical protein
MNKNQMRSPYNYQLDEKHEIGHEPEKYKGQTKCRLRSLNVFILKIINSHYPLMLSYFPIYLLRCLY